MPVDLIVRRHFGGLPLDGSGPEFGGGPLNVFVRDGGYLDTISLIGILFYWVYNRPIRLAA